MSELTVRRTFSASRERIWELWTTPQGLAQWWWPERFGTEYHVEAAPGGSYRFVTADTPPIGVLELAGTFLEVDPPNHLEYTWRWAADLEHESRVTVDLPDSDGGTSVSVHHVGLIDEDDRANHIQGWNDCLDRLESLTSG